MRRRRDRIDDAVEVVAQPVVVPVDTRPPRRGECGAGRRDADARRRRVRDRSVCRARHRARSKERAAGCGICVHRAIPNSLRRARERRAWSSAPGRRRLARRARHHASAACGCLRARSRATPCVKRSQFSRQRSSAISESRRHASPSAGSTRTPAKAVISAARISTSSRRPIDAARAAGRDVTGPIPADTIFVPDIARRYDAIVAMYHDQGLPALKAASFGGGVNVTLGLPFVRTSVDHGRRSISRSTPRRRAPQIPAASTPPSTSRVDLAARRRSLKAGSMRGHVARKRFGQNFLVDAHYVAKIVDAIDPRPGDNLVEIGPGLAALTGSLIERAGAITADRDRSRSRRSTCRGISARQARAPHRRRPRVRLRGARSAAARGRQPALQHQLATAVPARRIRSAIAGPARDAAAGGRRADDGAACHTRLRPALGDAAGQSFASRAFSSCRPARFSQRRKSTPRSRASFRSAPPNRTSMMPALFSRVVAAAFGQRRKTMRNALSAICDAATLEAAGIDPRARGKRCRHGLRAARERSRELILAARPPPRGSQFAVVSACPDGRGP